MTMDVCDDYTLAELDPQLRPGGPGAGARAALVEWVSEELEEAGRQYDDGGLLPSFDDEAQPLLPFALERLAER